MTTLRNSSLEVNVKVISISHFPLQSLPSPLPGVIITTITIKDTIVVYDGFATRTANETCVHYSTLRFNTNPSLNNFVFATATNQSIPSLSEQQCNWDSWSTPFGCNGKDGGGGRLCTRMCYL
jgi:hypothetical protein